MKNLKVLMVEDSEDDAVLMLRELRKGGFEVSYERVDNARSMQAALSQQKWDIILSDFALPHFSGLAALELYHQQDLDIPFIIISGTIGEGTAVEMMKAGTHDYLMKGNLARLAPAVERELREAQGRRDRRKTEEDLRFSEEKFSKAFRTSPDSIAINRLSDGLYVDINEGFTDLMGYTLEDVLGKTSFDLNIWVNPIDRKRLIEGMLASGEVRNMEASFLRRNGDVGIGLMSARIIDLGGHKCTLSITRDITDRKKTEEQLYKKNRAYRTISNCNMALVRAVNEQDLLNEVCKMVVEIGGYRTAWIGYALNDPSQSIKVMSQYGFKPGDLDIYDLSWNIDTPKGSGPSPTAIRSRQPVVINNMLALPEEILWRKDAIKNGYVGLIALPLIANGGVLGSISITSDEADLFDNEEISLLTEMVEDLAFGIQAIRSNEEKHHAEEELREAYDKTLEGWALALEMREFETAGHSRRVVDLTLALGRALNIPQKELVHLHRGALLHDIGKMGIPDSILRKPGPLTDDEWVVMRLHPGYAYDFLHAIPYLRTALDVPYCHHEKWDGTGYPRGLRGEAIPINARIFSIVDVWDALNSKRFYRPAWPEAEVKSYLLAQSGKQFDPQLVAIFVDLLNSTSPET